MFLRKYLLIIFLFLPFISSAQEIVSREWFIWLRYYNQARLSKKLVLHTELDNRWYLNPWHQSQFFGHIHLHDRIKPWMDVAVAFNVNFTNPPGNTTLIVPELRPWQEVSFFVASKRKWPLQFRYRLDERFIHNNNKAELTEGYHFNLRHRFRVMVTTRLFEMDNDRFLTLKIQDEIMLNTGDVPRTFDQNRASVSLEYQLSKHVSVESGYMNILQPITDTRYYDRNVIRTTLYHRIGS